MRSVSVANHIGYESWVERDHLVALDFDPAVTTIVSQPLWLLWFARGKIRRHAPDFLVQTAGGVLMLDSRPLDRIAQRDQEAFDAAEAACGQLGWRYAVWGQMDGVLVANQRWLAGYRHPRCFDEALAARLLSVFVRPRGLMAGAEEAGDPIASLPVLFHLMWRHHLLADLSLVLSDRTIVEAASSRVGNWHG
ncbi:TnsA-like heteromeric transposase endonuclease subunit [Nonomuraea sp. 10N515B]|uniref:TnsA-like heteromeric transposase endonuclease subunit n=1 Tax=Nonomuraea sp. 10N515B TaxID=3457422 RepID=UPI003FCD3B87